MNSKQNPIWIILCSLVCVAVAIGVLACLPNFEGSASGISALDVIVDFFRGNA